MTTKTKSPAHDAFHAHLRKKGVTDQSTHDKVDKAGFDPSEMDGLARALGIDPAELRDSGDPV
jgi:hypothetical protein